MYWKNPRRSRLRANCFGPDAAATASFAIRMASCEVALGIGILGLRIERGPVLRVRQRRENQRESKSQQHNLTPAFHSTEVFLNGLPILPEAPVCNARW